MRRAPSAKYMRCIGVPSATELATSGVKSIAGACVTSNVAAKLAMAVNVFIFPKIRSKALPATAGVLDALQGGRRLLLEKVRVEGPPARRGRVDVAGVVDAVKLLAEE